MVVPRSIHAWFAILSAGGYPGAQLLSKKFETLRLGDVRPSGWLYDQLEVQTNGMAGHEHEFYNYVEDTDWWGGNSAYSSLEEAGSYWFNAMVPNAVLMDSEVLLERVKFFLDYVLDHQEEGGWLGPEAGNSRTRYLWGRYPFFFGAMQYVEFFPEYTDRVVEAMHKFVPLANQMIRAGEGLEIWTNTRWEDFVIALQWLYDYHPNGNEDLLVDTMLQLKYSGVPWDEVFLEENFPTKEVDNLENPTGYVLSWHGVNMAEGMKSLPAMYRLTQNQSDIDRISSGWDLLFKYHGRPSGIYSADEYLAGLSATRGTELCTVVEAMFSANYLFQVIGDIKFLDQAERMAYNALPAELTGDMWHRQYDQQQNQIASKNMTPNPFYVNSAYSNVFGLEPYYPCCTVNHPQGWPKFITHSFLKSGEDGASLLQAYLGPISVNTVLDTGNVINVSVDTVYPFGDTINVEITATQDFSYFIRIPSWVTDGTLAVNEDDAEPIDSGQILEVPVTAGTTSLLLSLPSEITTEDRPNGSIAVHRGPLNYALDLPFTSTVIKTHPTESRATDLQLNPTVDWQYAIDSATFEFTNTGETDLPSPIFDENLPPVSITVMGCLIDWAKAGDSFADVPPSSPACVGERETLTLTPYGSTKLRISEFPTIG